MSKQTTRFVTLDLSSGYVWYCGDEASATDACVMSHACTGGYHSTEWAESTKTDAHAQGGYAVYIAPAGFEVEDGQDAHTIDAVEAMPLAGYFVRTTAEA